MPETTRPPGGVAAGNVAAGNVAARNVAARNVAAGNVAAGEPAAPDRQCWRCPAVPRVKAAVFAVVGVTVALVFFPAWFAVPVALLLAAWGLGLAVRGATVALDPSGGLLVLRVGLISRRIRLVDITAVLVDAAKVSIARSGGGEVSLYAWRRSPLDRWLRVPAVAADIGHAIASAVALARDAPDAALQDAPLHDAPLQDAPFHDARLHDAPLHDARLHDAPLQDARLHDARARGPVTTTPARSRSALATALLGCVGIFALAAAFLVRLSWHSPVMTAASVILALALGLSGLFYLLFTLWLLLASRSARAPRPSRTAPPGARSLLGVLTVK